MKILMTVAFAAMVLFLAPASVSAQEPAECNPAVAHAHMVRQTVAWCDENGRVSCDDICECDSGYHPRDRSQPVGASNPCVRNVAGDRDGDGDVDISGNVCIGDAEGRTLRGGLVVCQCPDALDTEDRNGDGTPDHDADQDGIQETRRTRVDWDRSERRAMGVPLTGVIYDCRSASSMLSTQVEIDNSAMEQRLTWLEQQIRTICGTTDETATPDDIHEDCQAFHDAALRSGGGPTTITIGDTEMSLGEFAERVMGRLAAIDETNNRQDDAIGQLRLDVDELQRGSDAWRDFLDATHVRLGLFAQVGGLLPGPATGAGGASFELLFRFGDLPVGAYGRVNFGGQSTGWNVGESLYLSGGAGFTAFTGGRADTTVSLGLWGETLFDPFVANDVFPHDSHGVAIGGELGISIPMPGAHWVRLRGSVTAGLFERRLIDDQGAYQTPQSFGMAGTLGIEFQPDL